MKGHEIRAKETSAIESELLGLRREWFNLKMRKGTGQLTRSSQMKLVRRNIARFKTILNERRQGAKYHE